MNILKKFYCRSFQEIFHIALPFLPYRNPVLKEHLEDIGDILKTERLLKPLIITDSTLSSIGAAEPIKKLLVEKGFNFAFFDGAFPNPTTDLADGAAKVYTENSCDCLIAFGGGSPIDLAKAVAIKSVCPDKKLVKFGGILKVHRRLPVLIAIPTTAGTGSETTLAAVLVDSATRRKFAINDFPLIPKYAILDSVTLHSLPPHIAVATGLDALTHAVEAYIGRSTTKETRTDAEIAVKLIFENLDKAVNHESSAERLMLYASHYAGRAFTRSYVGYIHAVSHTLSGKYNLAHADTNAVLMPRILRRYGRTVYNKLARLAVASGIGEESENKETLAERFISKIENINKKYNIPEYIPEIKEEDIKILARYASKEANPLYPVPVLWDASELEKIYREVMR